MKRFVYILKCQNNAYYTGYTVNMERRYQEHAEGSPKCKYTRSFPPLGIAACWEIDSDLATVLKLEYYIKHLTRKQKESIIYRPERLFVQFVPRLPEELQKGIRHWNPYKSIHILS